MTTARTSLDVAQPADSFHVPELNGMLMVEQCALQLERALTIPDVLLAMKQADAIAAVMRKIKASERAKRAALRLQLDAEIALGMLTKQIPQAMAGRGGAARPEQVTKNSVLKQHGIHSNRSNIAEKLASVPADKIEDAMDRSRSKTVTGVAQFLGCRNKAPYVSASRMKKVAHDAIGLLVRCQSERRAPRGEEVGPLREAFSAADSVITSGEER